MDGINRYPMALPLGSVLAGQYIIEGVLGQGGFGITYAARDHARNTIVAIKEYFPDSIATRVNQSTVVPYSGNKGENYAYGLECFKKEAYTLGQFTDNPNIVRIHCYFEENSTAYFVMDMIRGMSLAHYMKQKKMLSYEETLRILLPVMYALVYVHSKGIVHRDISPDNIYLEDGGGIKLLDFGAARYSIGDRTQSLSIILKHGFAPPEQYQSRGHQGPFTDVYAMGATFYYCMSGRKLPDSIERMEDDRLIPLSARGVSLPQDADLAIMSALSIDRKKRFQNMTAFINALQVDKMVLPRPVMPRQTNMQMNGMAMNGMPMNGMAANGVPGNGMPMNGTPSSAMQKPSVASAFVQPHEGLTSENRSTPVRKDSLSGKVLAAAIIAPILLMWGGYLFTEGIAFTDTIFIIFFICVSCFMALVMNIIFSSGKKGNYDKGMRSLRMWNFDEAEKYLYPLLTDSRYDAVAIYRELYQEAKLADAEDRAKRYLSEVKDSYGKDAEERVKNSK